MLSLSHGISFQKCRDGSFAHVAMLNIDIEIGLLPRVVAVSLLQLDSLLLRLLVEQLLLLVLLLLWRLLLLMVVLQLGVLLRLLLCAVQQVAVVQVQILHPEADSRCQQ